MQTTSNNSRLTPPVNIPCISPRINPVKVVSSNAEQGNTSIPDVESPRIFKIDDVNSPKAVKKPEISDAYKKLHKYHERKRKKRADQISNQANRATNDPEKQVFGFSPLGKTQEKKS